MSGMLGRAPANVPALGKRAEVFVAADGSKRFCKAWPRGVQDLVVEPTSVLDIRSPSPSSTLSSSIAGSSESGLQQGSSETGGAVAVSGLFYEGTSEGQLPDCTSLLEGGEVGSVWGLETGEDGGTKEDFGGTWQLASSGNMFRNWDRNLATGQDAACKHVDGRPPVIIRGVVAGLLPEGNVGEPMNPGFMQVVGMGQEKQRRAGGQVLRKPEIFNIAPSIRVGNLSEKMMKHDVPIVADESLEACVMSCRKRDREDSLGEVVQRLGGGGSGFGGQKIEAGEWLSDWNELGKHTSTIAGVDEKVVPGHLEDLDDIFSSSPAPPPPVEFWLSENLPSQQQQQVNSRDAAVEVFRGQNVGHGNPQTASRAQLDLFEAVQAGLLYRGGNSSAAVGRSGGFLPVGDVPPPPPPPTVTFQSPTPALSRSHSAPVTSPLHQQFSSGGSLLPFHRHSSGGSTPPAGQFTPNFVDVKPPVPASSLLSATFTPTLPQFSSQFHELSFPLPAYQRQVPPPQAQSFGLQMPEYRSSKSEFVDGKPWQMRPLDREAGPKVLPGGGPKWQLKPESGWQQVERPIPGHVRIPALSQRPAIAAEQAPRHQVMPEVVGWRVRLEDLSLAERLLSAASEAAQLGDCVSAQAILARLNQQMSSKGQQQKLPSQRVTLLFSEALAKSVSAGSSTCSSPYQSNSPLDLINKISAYKSFCEVSPISQFAHFTANQAILDAIEGEDSVHLVDFELGSGGQWASFMQEIAQRGQGPPELKITTMGADSLEMRLAKENLLQFAKEMGMKLDVNVIPVQKLEGIKAGMLKRGEKEALAVNFGFGLSRLMSEFSASSEAVVAFLQMVKGLSPKVVAVVDSECEFEGMSAYMETLQFYACVFESLEACTRLPREVVGNIEELVFGPKIADLVSARHVSKSTGESSLPPWRILLKKVGFSSLPFGSAAESQAKWLVKNPLNSGFTVLKQDSTLLLGWHNKTLISASAWV